MQRNKRNMLLPQVVTRHLSVFCNVDIAFTAGSRRLIICFGVIMTQPKSQCPISCKLRYDLPFR